MAIYNLINQFEREIEVLDIIDQKMIYAIDRKSENGNLCEIGMYDLVEATNSLLLTLPDTRLYESFETYHDQPDFFYAVNVDDDYTIHLTKIDKKSWQIAGQYALKAEGEITNIYASDDTHLIVTDETEVTDKLMIQHHNAGYDGKYCTLTYVYDLLTGEKQYRDAFTFDKNDQSADETNIPSYDEKYGDFSFRIDANSFVTQFYEPKMVRDDCIFVECCAIHYDNGAKPEIFNGRAIKIGDSVILLRSFLCL